MFVQELTSKEMEAAEKIKEAIIRVVNNFGFLRIDGLRKLNEVTGAISTIEKKPGTALRIDHNCTMIFIALKTGELYAAKKEWVTDDLIISQLLHANRSSVKQADLNPLGEGEICFCDAIEMFSMIASQKIQGIHGLQGELNSQKKGLIELRNKFRPQKKS